MDFSDEASLGAARRQRAVDRRCVDPVAGVRFAQRNRAIGPLMASQKPPTTLATVLCCAPLLIEVVRVALEGEATAHSMTVLGAVAVFGLPAYLGQKWALSSAPYVFLAAGVEMVLVSIFGTYELYYWVLVCGLIWCGYELSAASDVRTFLSERKGNV